MSAPTITRAEPGAMSHREILEALSGLLLVLFVAMGLKYMGIADSIIELGFGALVVGGAAAAALAFGLGGRDQAARQLERLSAKAEARSHEDRHQL